MIIDSITRLNVYVSVNKRFEKALSYLSGIDLESLPDGRYEIDGDDIYMTISEHGLKIPADTLLETHDKYIDLQIVIRGAESFGWKQREECVIPRGKYGQMAADILFYDDVPTTYFTLMQSQFVIFFTTDAHAPLVHAPLAPSAGVRKAVVKIRV